MKRCLIFVLLASLLAACVGAPTPIGDAPTLASLPTTTATLTITATASGTPSATPTLTPTATFTETPTLTVTPSLTITDTPTGTATDTQTPTTTPTPTEENAALVSLLELALQATVLPAPLAPPGLTPGQPTIAPLNVACAYPPPGGFGAVYSTELSGLLGCPVGAPPLVTSVNSAYQPFERGAMIYLAGPPSVIYALFGDGRFRRFDDTWVEGVDPVEGADVPPFNLFEPVRGFGKVWRENADVRGSLGWGAMAEAGATATLLPFDRGRMVYLPQRGEIVAQIDDPGGLTGTWRASPGAP